jgi:hypothetical protein
LTTTYQTIALTRLILPTVDVPAIGSVAGVQINITANTGWGALVPTLDEAWLFNVTIGQLIQVDCGTGAGASGGAARRLWISPPNQTTPRPTLLMGHSTDKSDAFYSSAPAVPVYGPVAWQQPKFDGPQTNVFAVTPNATDAVISLSYYPRWHTNAAS